MPVETAEERVEGAEARMPSSILSVLSLAPEKSTTSFGDQQTLVPLSGVLSSSRLLMGRILESGLISPPRATVARTPEMPCGPPCGREGEGRAAQEGAAGVRRSSGLNAQEVILDQQRGGLGCRARGESERTRGARSVAHPLLCAVGRLDATALEMCRRVDEFGRLADGLGETARGEGMPWGQANVTREERIHGGTVRRLQSSCAVREGGWQDVCSVRQWAAGLTDSSLE